MFYQSKNELNCNFEKDYQTNFGMILYTKCTFFAFEVTVLDFMTCHQKLCILEQSIKILEIVALASFCIFCPAPAIFIQNYVYRSEDSKENCFNKWGYKLPYFLLSLLQIPTLCISKAILFFIVTNCCINWAEKVVSTIQYQK